jgi:hypothetical protein
MRNLLLAVALNLALLCPAGRAQPAWGPVYHWGHEEGANDRPTGYFKQVSAGWDYTVGLRPNGSIEVWGTVGDTPGVTGPHHDVFDTNLPAAGTWISIQAGFEEAIALNADGSVHVWGYHYGPYNCEGDEITLDDCAGCDFSAVAAGENFFVGIVDGGTHNGDLFVWGGVYCFNPRSLTDEGYVDAGTSQYFTTVSACGHHILAKKSSGFIALANPIPEDGTGSCAECCAPKYLFNPGEFPPPSNQDWWGTPPTTVTLFTAGHGHSVIWNDNSSTGVIFGWGMNQYGQAGIVTDGVDVAPDCDPEHAYYNDTTAAYPGERTDVENLTFASDPVKLEGADGNTTALLAAGTLVAWGRNTADTDQQSDVPGGTFLDFSSKTFHGAAISTCYADCDANGELTTFDYLCFYNLVQANDISADCNEDTYVNSYDLTCFQALLTAGCP